MRRHNHFESKLQFLLDIYSKYFNFITGLNYQNCLPILSPRQIQAFFSFFQVWVSDLLKKKLFDVPVNISSACGLAVTDWFYIGGFVCLITLSCRLYIV